MKRRAQATLAVVMTILLPGLFAATSSPATAQAVSGQGASFSGSRGLAAVDAAARNGKYLFIFFWKTDNEQSQSMYRVFQSTVDKWADSADSVSIPIIDSKEKALVDKFDVSRAPMPLVLAVAPCGAVTKAFPIKFSENQLREGFVSPCAEKCLKALQERKLVLLCVENESTRFSQAALSGARSFNADVRYAKSSEIVTLDPADQAEAQFLKDLAVDPATSQAVTVLLAPPGQPVAKFVGAVTKEQLIAKLQTAQSGPCAGGVCGPGGCAPKK